MKRKVLLALIMSLLLAGCSDVGATGDEQGTGREAGVVKEREAGGETGVAEEREAGRETDLAEEREAGGESRGSKDSEAEGSKEQGNLQKDESGTEKSGTEKSESGQTEKQEGELARLDAKEQGGIDPVTLDNAYQRAAFLADQVYQANRSNTLVSPLSLEMALGLAAEGASGETAKELYKYLGNDQYADWVDEYMSFAESLKSEKKETSEDSEDRWLYDAKYSFCYEIANSLWVRQGDALDQDYQNLVEKKFRAEAANVDFAGEPQKTADRINDWCKERTHEMIPKIVTPEMFDSNLATILMNTVYFESPWLDKWGLKEHDFKGLSGKVTTQEMLADTVKLYYENENCTAFGKRYYNGFTFIGILPKQEGDFSISELDLKSLLDSESSEYDVKAIAPKLDFDSTANNVVEILKAQGVTKMFDQDLAEFDRLVAGRELHVSDIIQKCKIEMDEEGTRAAAVTAMLMGTNSVSIVKERKVKEVYLDRPFAFLIYDSANDQIVFVGKVTEL